MRPSGPTVVGDPHGHARWQRWADRTTSGWRPSALSHHGVAWLAVADAEWLMPFDLATANVRRGRSRLAVFDIPGRPTSGTRTATGRVPIGTAVRVRW